MNSSRPISHSLRLLSRLNNKNLYSVINGRQLSSCQMCLASQKQALENDDGPIKFSQSEASRTIPHYLNERIDQNPVSRTISIGLSMGAFMLWFFVLREENDWDENVTRSLYDRVDGMEKTNLMTAIKYYQKNGMDASPLVRRLMEIEAEETAANAEGMATEASLTAAARE